MRLLTIIKTSKSVACLLTEMKSFTLAFLLVFLACLLLVQECSSKPGTPESEETLSREKRQDFSAQNLIKLAINYIIDFIVDAAAAPIILFINGTVAAFG
ncbi:hypothetical protein JTE90_025676 [Oedothorax gibbosus]|uniref:Uncharacterized protein n=1 Tax=Oedothorax gibbosus TaxID=931172 RepID=A0AAV6UCC1_9ARAC|nr:hypothetical protein JTE90_025676 [Oedothorax gibbosus]